MERSYYKQARDKALKDYREISRQIHELNLRKGQLRETITALNSLCSRLPNVESLSLSNAIRVVYATANRFLTPIEVKGKLEDLGYNVSRFKNPLASIHTALERMAKTDELSKREDEDEKKFEAGKKLKKPPVEVQSSGGDAALAAMGIGDEDKEDKTDDQSLGQS
jgi:hypothetical protein